MRTAHFSCHLGGGGFYLGEGVSAWGVSAHGAVCLGVYTPCEQNDWQAGVKTLPQTLFAGGKNWTILRVIAVYLLFDITVSSIILVQELQWTFWVVFGREWVWSVRVSWVWEVVGVRSAWAWAYKLCSYRAKAISKAKIFFDFLPFITSRKRSLGQGHSFTGIYLPVHRRGVW